jgi:hypothetical protein
MSKFLAYLIGLGLCQGQRSYCLLLLIAQTLIRVSSSVYSVLRTYVILRPHAGAGIQILTADKHCRTCPWGP